MCTKIVRGGLFLFLVAGSYQSVEAAPLQEPASTAVPEEVRAAEEGKAAPVAGEREQPVVAESGVGGITFSGLVQVWGATSNSGQQDAFRLRRTELKASGRIVPSARWTVMVDPSKTPLLKDAFLTLTVIPHVRVDVGQHKIPLGAEGLASSAALDTVERALFISKGGMGDVRDIGVTVNAPVTKYVNVWVGQFNGSAVNNRNATAWRVVVRPAEGLQFGGSGAYANGDGLRYRSWRNRLGAELQYVHGPLTLKSERMTGRDGAASRQGHYVHLGYKVRDRIEPVVRLDVYDPNVADGSSPADVLERDYLTGFNYYLSGNHLKCQLNYIRKNFARHLVPDRNVLLVNLQAFW